MTAPITPDERAAMRAIADRMETYYGEADAASGIRRLLDALDTAEARGRMAETNLTVAGRALGKALAEVARLREDAEVLRGWITEHEETIVETSDALDEASRPVPVWDEDTVTEAVARAMFPHYFTDDRQPLRVFTETRSDAELREAEREAARRKARQALAVVREHLPVRPDRETVLRALAQADGQDLDGYDIGHTAEMQYGAQADAVLDAWPGESRATVQAEELRDAADEWHAEHYGTRPAAYKFLWDRADRLDPKETDRG